MIIQKRNSSIFAGLRHFLNTADYERDYNSNFHIYNTAGDGASCAGKESVEALIVPQLFYFPSKIFDK